MKEQTAVAGNCIVSYASKPYQAIAIPAEKPPAVLTDFKTFKTEKKPSAPTEIRLRRDSKNLYLDVFCFENRTIHDQNCKDGMPLFEDGDRLEIFFGAIDPIPWMIQIAIGAGGGRFDSQGRENEWKSAITRDLNGWYVKLQIPLNLLRIQNLSCGFNLCRYRESAMEYSTWCGLETKFHEPENFGKLLFCDYETAYFAITGQTPGKKIQSRAAFEKVMEKCLTPAQTVIHGPFLSNPEPNAMTVSWETAGMCAAALEFRQKGKKNWITKYAELKNGILKRNSAFHVVHLTDLKENTEYEYRLANIHPLLTKREITESPEYHFRTLNSRKKCFTFTLTSDVHSDVKTLKTFLSSEHVKKSDLLINAGDLLASMSGPEAFHQGFLNCQTALFAKNKPLVFVRGNHEQVGIFSADYDRMFSHPSGRTYYAFRHGDCCFIVLDAGNDHPDDPYGIHQNTAMVAEERQWLEELVKSALYKEATHRIICMHIPPFSKEKYDLGMAYALVDNVFPADAQPDLMLCGHLHHYIRISPYGKEIITRNGFQLQYTDFLHAPYPIIANDIDTCITVDVTPASLKVRVMDSKGKTVDTLTKE